MRRIVVYDDGRGRLSPLTDLRAAFDVRTGALTTLERVERVTGSRVAGVIVPEALAGVTRERHPGVAVNGPMEGLGEVLAVNGRWAVVSSAALREVDANGRCLAGEGADGAEALAWVAGAKDLVGMVAGGGAEALRRAPFSNRGVSDGAKWAGVMTRPWHVRTFRDACLALDLELIGASIQSVGLRADSGVIHVKGRDLEIHAGARVCPGVVLDCEAGAVVIDEGAVVRPGATVIGPAYVGKHSTVLDRAVVRGGTALGPWCKVAGEVSGTVFQGYANKAHDGYLGDSWVGEWVNLGAGTTNSNLLNTYGEVTARAMGADGVPGPMERTGEQFLGAIIGDHVKTAIMTRIMTGAVVGTGTMWAATRAISGTVGAFAWATDGAGGETAPKRYAAGKFVEVMRSAMARRKVTPGAGYMARVEALLGR